MRRFTLFPNASSVGLTNHPQSNLKPCWPSARCCNPCAAKSSRNYTAQVAACAAAGRRQTAERTAVRLPDLPATYKRLVAHRCGPSFRQVTVVQELPLQPPGPGEVLIRITHAGINGGCETFRARGEHAFAPNRAMQDFPLGAEGSGLVVALGPDAGGGLQLGQRVAVNGAAAFSEFVVARPSLVTPLVEGVGCAEGAALVLSGVTACAALEATARVRPGEVVAVTAAAGGTGHLAVQLAAAAGATVVGIVGGGTANKKAEAVAALGAHHVIDRTSQDVASELARLFPGGVDVVYDGVGGALRDQLLGCLGPTGRLLQVGYISEYPHTQAYRWDQRDGGDGDDGGGDGGREGGGGCPGNVALDEAEVPAASTAAAAAAAASTAPTAAPTSALPPSEQLFWGGVDVSLGQRRVIGQIWPKDLKAILRCRRRVFDLAARGQLRVLTDQGHGRKGVEGVADAVDYMLRGEHVGKVIIEI